MKMKIRDDIVSVDTKFDHHWSNGWYLFKIIAYAPNADFEANKVRLNIKLKDEEHERHFVILQQRDGNYPDTGSCYAGLVVHYPKDNPHIVKCIEIRGNLWTPQTP